MGEANLQAMVAKFQWTDVRVGSNPTSGNMFSTKWQPSQSSVIGTAEWEPQLDAVEIKSTPQCTFAPCAASKLSQMVKRVVRPWVGSNHQPFG